MTTVYIGIDIGLTGAVAAIANGHALVLDIPTREETKGRRIDGRLLIHALRTLIDVRDVAGVIAEDVQARPFGNGGEAGNTMHSQGSVMRSRGIVEAVTDIGQWPVTWVQPQTWKRHYGLLKKPGEDAATARRRTKALAREVATSLYPGLAHDLRLAKHDGRADALLMAHYLRTRPQ